MDDPIPVYGTPGGGPGGDSADDSLPVYGSPEPPASKADEQRNKRPAPGRFAMIVRRLRTLRGTRLRGSGPDWRDYPGRVFGDLQVVLDRPRQNEVVARYDGVLARIRRALAAEFAVHWWDNSDPEGLTPTMNEWGGESVLEAWNSAIWRTTSGLTSIEDRDMASAIAATALTHEGFVERSSDRSVDRWMQTYEDETNPDSVVTLEIGYSELELSMSAGSTLASEREAEFHRRAHPFRSAPKPS